jgi:hypothetical protein
VFAERRNIIEEEEEEEEGCEPAHCRKCRLAL